MNLTEQDNRVVISVERGKYLAAHLVNGKWIKWAAPLNDPYIVRPLESVAHYWTEMAPEGHVWVTERVTP